MLRAAAVNASFPPMASGSNLYLSRIGCSLHRTTCQMPCHPSWSSRCCALESRTAASSRIPGRAQWCLTCWALGQRGNFPGRCLKLRCRILAHEDDRNHTASCACTFHSFASRTCRAGKAAGCRSSGARLNQMRAVLKATLQRTNASRRRGKCNEDHS